MLNQQGVLSSPEVWSKNLPQVEEHISVWQRGAQKERERVLASDSLGLQFRVSVFLTQWKKKTKDKIPEPAIALCLKTERPLKMDSLHGGMKVTIRHTSIMDSFLQVQHHAGCYRSKRAKKGGREGSRYRRTGLGKLNKDMTPGQSRSLFHIYLQLFSLFAIKCFPPKTLKLLIKMHLFKAQILSCQFNSV